TAVLAVLSLHRVAIDLILSKSDDASRFDKAAPHVQALLDSADPRSQAIGHLVAGSIDLDPSGAAPEQARGQDRPARRPPPAEAPRHRPDPPQPGRPRPARGRRGPGQVRRRPGAGAGAEPRPPVPPERPEGRRARAPVPALGGLDDPPGRLSRRSRADRTVDV